MKKKSDTITINKKVLPGIICSIPLIAILISKHRIGELLLFLMGIGIGTYIGLNLKSK
ncbi:hypothetical protein KY311_04140 [Candidatus Woesearchaeota archaeon]|nr:hypothetical protein [Candidatus Woesearchaeota archaeon]